MRLPPALLLASVLALALPACSGADGGVDGGTGPPPSATSVPPSPTSSPTPSATPTTTTSPIPSHSPGEVALPEDAPATVDDPEALARIATGDLSPLAPPGAKVGSSQRQTEPFEQIALTWRRGDDPFAQEQGFVVWQRFDPVWAAVYAFTDAPEDGVLGISAEGGDLTDDGIVEFLTFEPTGGTGACGRWRVVSTVSGSAGEVFRRDTCDTEIRIAGSALEVREAIYGPNDPHCCPSAFRTTTLEWDGERFVETSVEEEPTST